MKSTLKPYLIAASFLALSSVAHAESKDDSIELGFMPSAMDVTLLNEGGKFVTAEEDREGREVPHGKRRGGHEGRAWRNPWYHPRSLRRPKSLARRLSVHD